VKGNEMFTTFPFEPHGSTRLLQNPSSFYGFQVNLKKPTGLLGLNKEYSRALYSILTTMRKRHLHFTSAETQLLKTSFDCIGSGEPERLRLGVQYLSCFLFRIPDFEEVPEEEPESDNTFFSRVLDYIDRNFQEELRLQDLADISGYSLSRFKMKFKEEIGITPANFITFRKLEHSKKLLANTDHSITQIALDSGFSSSNYFCTVMKRVSNYTPSEFRRMIRGTDLSFSL
jgi:AraC-like DNA-binding protein